MAGTHLLHRPPSSPVHSCRTLQPTLPRRAPPQPLPRVNVGVQGGADAFFRPRPRRHALLPPPPPAATPTHANPPLAGFAHRCVGVCCCGATDARAARASFVRPRPAPLWSPLHGHSSAPAFAVSMAWWLAGAAGNPVRPFAHKKKTGSTGAAGRYVRFFLSSEPDHPAMPPAHRSGGYRHSPAYDGPDGSNAPGAGWGRLAVRLASGSAPALVSMWGGHAARQDAGDRSVVSMHWWVPGLLGSWRGRTILSGMIPTESPPPPLANCFCVGRLQLLTADPSRSR